MKKYICEVCKYLGKHSKEYSFSEYSKYKAHKYKENELAPDYKYLEDKNGFHHTSCLLVSEPNHSPCPAHPEL